MSLTPKTNPSPYPLPRHFKVCEHGEKEQVKNQEEDNPYHDTQTARYTHFAPYPRASCPDLLTQVFPISTLVVVVVEDFFFSSLPVAHISHSFV